MATIATELLEAKRDERRRRITPAAEREARVRAYPESGLTQRAFAKEEGVQVFNLRIVGAGAAEAKAECETTI